MFGLITRKDLLMHPVTVCRHYGWRVLVIGILGHRGTFLDLVARRADASPARRHGPKADRPNPKGRPR
jgi:hypothetical protein